MGGKKQLRTIRDIWVPLTRLLLHRLTSWFSPDFDASSVDASYSKLLRNRDDKKSQPLRPTDWNSKNQKLQRRPHYERKIPERENAKQCDGICRIHPNVYSSPQTGSRNKCLACIGNSINTV